MPARHIRLRNGRGPTRYESGHVPTRTGWRQQASCFVSTKVLPPAGDNSLPRISSTYLLWQYPMDLFRYGINVPTQFDDWPRIQLWSSDSSGSSASLGINRTTIFASFNIVPEIEKSTAQFELGWLGSYATTSEMPD